MDCKNEMILCIALERLSECKDYPLKANIYNLITSASNLINFAIDGSCAEQLSAQDWEQIEIEIENC